ncbi:putative serine/threonine-protein phosphatase 4 regulatory subunit 1-like isoform X1 [Muntiacus reevesi]|uniref:putative serine/threonine-protein phosphatase 4 regulatory subunit 1-like isoform X1 n=1 Tax=Muntiacus reevesi TaxID=9886 RepID=UPI00330714BE
MPLYFVDLQDDLDDYGFEDYGPDCNGMRVTAFLDIPGQDNLPPLAHLQKYAFSAVASSTEPTVRTELMEQIPPLAISLRENRSDFPVVLSECLIPVMVRYLTDTDNQTICKLSSVLSKCAVERLLFPRICELCGYGKLFQVRKVLQAAFQSLGPFISTFANPSRAGLYIQEDGTLNI